MCFIFMHQTLNRKETMKKIEHLSRLKLIYVLCSREKREVASHNILCLLLWIDMGTGSLSFPK